MGGDFTEFWLDMLEASEVGSVERLGEVIYMNFWFVILEAA